MEPDMYEPGCYIDCSHLDADYLNYCVINFVVKNFEWDGGNFDTKALILDYNYFTIADPDMSQDMTEDEFFTWQNELSESLYFAADDAVQFLNSEIVSGSGYWTIEDNSLYLMEDSDDDY